MSKSSCLLKGVGHQHGSGAFIVNVKFLHCSSVSLLTLIKCLLGGVGVQFNLARTCGNVFFEMEGSFGGLGVAGHLTY